MTGSAAGVPV